MGLAIGDVVPDFFAETTAGPIHFHEWIAGQWVLLFVHSGNFKQEAIELSLVQDDLQRLNVKAIGLSDGRHLSDVVLRYPLIIDSDSHISELLGLGLPSVAYGMPNIGSAQLAMVGELSVGYAVVIGPDKRIRLTLLYPKGQTVTFRDILRVIDSLRLTERYPAATWKQGEDVIISSPSSSVTILGGIDTATPRQLPPELSHLFKA